MAATTYSSDHETGISARVSTFFHDLFDHMMTARQNQADRYIARHLSTFDDRTLANAGIKRANIYRRPRDLASF